MKQTIYRIKQILKKGDADYANYNLVFKLSYI